MKKIILLALTVVAFSLSLDGSVVSVQARGRSGMDPMNHPGGRCTIKAVMIKHKKVMRRVCGG